MNRAITHKDEETGPTQNTLISEPDSRQAETAAVGDVDTVVFTASQAKGGGGEQPDIRNWSISTGRHKTFSIEHEQAMDVDTAVEMMFKYAFILTQGGAAPVIDKEKWRAHLACIGEQFDLEKGNALAIETAKDFEFPAEVILKTWTHCANSVL